MEEFSAKYENAHTALTNAASSPAGSAPPSINDAQSIIEYENVYLKPPDILENIATDMTAIPNDMALGSHSSVSTKSMIGIKAQLTTYKSERRDRSTMPNGFFP